MSRIADFPGAEQALRKSKKLNALVRGFSPTLILPKRLHALYRNDIEHVRAHPRFSEALKASVVPYREIVLEGGEPWFAKYIGDLANNILEMGALYFHLNAKQTGKGTGATLGKLQLLAFVHGFASPRRVTMYVKRMIQIGRLSQGGGASDRRVRLLIPSDELIKTARRHILTLCYPADVLWPNQNLVTRVTDDDDFFARFYLELGRAYVEGADPARPFGDIRHFTSKDAGTFLLNTMMTECFKVAPELSPEAAFSINYSDIARQCGVSRTHVRNVIESAAERDLVVLEGEGGRSLRLTQKFITSYERFFACLMILTQSSAKKALHE